MANTPAYALTTISGGINRLRTKGGADKNSLYDLLNGYVTQSSTVKVRPGTFRNANIATYSGAGATKGLLAYQNKLHIFAASVVPVPPGYTLHVLNFPASSSTNVSRVSADPSFSSVSLLLHFDGTNGQNTTVDSSNAGNVVSINSGALSTANPKFGTAAFLTSGANLLNSYAVATPFSSGSPLDVFATPEWTIECWVWVNGVGIAAPMLFCDYGGSKTGAVTSNMIFSVSVDAGNTTMTVAAQDYAAFGTTATISATGAGTINTWHHVALVSHSGVTKLYLDGVASNQTRIDWIPANYGGVGTKNVVIGSSSRYSGGTTSGQIDEFRVTGLARYTANFVPAGPFPGYTLNPVTIKEIHFAAPYLGGIYVVAEFNASPSDAAAFGTVFHFWIQSSTGGDNSNAWVANQNYKIGDVVIPSVQNGLTYVASRRLPANPTWLPNTTETVGNIVEPVVANGFQYACTATLGATPTTGAVEPTWPLADGGTVNENSALAVDQTITLATAANPTVTPSTPKRYVGIAGGFSSPSKK